ncbi:T9SS type A sorting domain-containing protein [Lacinutrix iliipiscaria]|uniref:T9SS type A sorting domain-containing protein n=1 Tax=Lacinutrix iliipiscaria TaxID=1230532 RepID=A0ABW5WMG4_9FLAO
MKKNTYLSILIICLLVSYTSDAQTVYQLDHIHRYTWENDDWLRNVEEYYDYNIGGIKETNVLNKVSADGISFTDNFRHTKSYNSNNFIIEDVKQLWNGSTWIDDTKTSTTYDGDDNILQELHQKHNGVIWENETKTENTYTETVEENFFYDKYEDDTWVLKRQAINTLTDEGYDVEVWSRNYSTEVFEPNTNDIYTISNDLIESIIYQSWDATLTVPGWKNNEQLIITYTPENVYETLEYYLWDNSLMDWETEPYNRSTYIRDDATYNLIILSENYNGSAWENEFRSLQIYDVNDNVLSTEWQEWDSSLGTGGDWFTFSFVPSTYDENNNHTQVIYQYNYDETELENSSRTDKFWSEATALSVSFNSIENISLYPNPTTDIINVKFKSPTTYSSDALLYDMQGKLIHKVIIEAGNSTAKIPIKYEADGMYMLHINTKTSTQTYKIIKTN